MLYDNSQPGYSIVSLRVTLLKVIVFQVIVLPEGNSISRQGHDF